MKEKKVYYCPECGEKMTSSGYSWSGRNKVVRFRCLSCGRTTIKPKGMTEHVLIKRVTKRGE